MSRLSSFHRYAQRYHDKGYSIIPIRPGAKAPIIRGWQQHCDQLPTEDNLERWHSRYSNAGIGVCCGQASGVVGFDLDLDTNDHTQNEIYNQIIDLLPHSPVEKRGKKGSTKFFRYSGERAESLSTFANGQRINVIDILGTKRQSILPDTPHCDTGEPYEWIGDAALYEVSPEDLPVLDAQVLVNIRAALGGGHPSGGAQGGRNNHLKSVAFRLLRQGQTDEQIANELLAVDVSEHLSSLFSDNSEPQMRGRSPLENALRFVRSIRKSTGQAEIRWGVPTVPHYLTLEAPDLELTDYPPVLRPWLEDVSQRLSVKQDLVGVPAIAALSSTVGRRLLVRPKQHDDYEVTPNLWGGVVAESGSRKSPAIEAAVDPLRKLVAAAHTQHERDLAEFKLRKDEIEQQLKELKKELHEGDPDESDNIKAEIESLTQELDSGEPKLKRYIVNDVTSERLAELFRDNPLGLLCLRDELSGLLESMKKQQRETERAFLLECWSGNGQFSIDRKTVASTHVRAMCLAIFGGIQPEPLNHYLHWMKKRGQLGDGLIQRFQLLIAPTALPEFTYVDQPVNQEAKREIERIFNRIAEIDRDIAESLLGAEINEKGRPFLRFSSEAQVVYRDWLIQHEQRRSSGEISDPILRSHLSKYNSLVPSLALIFHLVNWCGSHGSEDRAISKDAIEMAIRWAQYLEAHAQKIFIEANNRDIEAALMLIEKIRHCDLRDGATVRSLYRKHWAMLNDKEDAEAALAILEENHWLRLVQQNSGGRPSLVIRLNPRLIGGDQ